ncbi:MAG: hypothetical protein ABEJ61_11075 [Haloferacaceae archaeon]
MDDRSERLRKRRKRSTATSSSNGRLGGDETDETDEASGTEEPSEPPESSKPSEPHQNGDAVGRGETDGETERAGVKDRSESVKDQQVGTYMYLPEDQVKRLRRQYNVLKAEYEFEYDEEFEKNRHFYPLVVRYGLERLDELDTAEIRSRLTELYR